MGLKVTIIIDIQDHAIAMIIKPTTNFAAIPL